MFDRNTRVREVLHLPGLSDLIEAHAGRKVPAVWLRLGANLTLAEVGARAHWNDQQIDNVIAELNRLAAAGDR